jgi:hypothetical protein
MRDRLKMLLYHRAPFSPEIKAPQRPRLSRLLPRRTRHDRYSPFGARLFASIWPMGSPSDHFGISKNQLSRRYCCAVTGPVRIPWGLVWGSRSRGVAARMGAAPAGGVVGAVAGGSWCGGGNFLGVSAVAGNRLGV